jgi:hypothetical protein
MLVKKVIHQILLQSHPPGLSSFVSQHTLPIQPSLTTQSKVNDQKFSQQSVKRWTIYRPFLPHILHNQNQSNIKISKPIPMHHHQCFTDHLLPLGNPMPVIDPTHILRICMQNTQHDFQIYGDGLEITTISNNLQSLGINMFIPISPNVNWINPYYWFHTRQLFHYNFHHVNLSAVSSDIGLDPLYLHKHLMGGVAILTLGL